MISNSRISKFIVGAILGGFLLAVLCWVTIARPYTNTPDIRSDGVGYHVWVHALAHGDFSFCKYRSLLVPVAAISSEDVEHQRCRVKYPPGVGILQLPFSWPWLATDPATGGFSEGENRAVLLLGAAMLLGCCLLMLAVLLKRRISAPVAAISVVSLVFGTGLFHYATFDASFSHIYSAFGVALLLWLGHRDHAFSPAVLVVFAVVVGWLYLVRQTNGALTLAVAYLVFRENTRAERWRLYAAWVAGTAAAIIMQVAYNRYASGSATLSSYGKEGFPSFARHSFDVLFSYERGLYTYYPIFLVVTVLGVIQSRRPAAQAFLAVGAMFALLYGSWHSWYLGAGFGHRGFVELVPIAMIVLGDYMACAKAPWRRVGVATMGLCCAATLLTMCAYWRGDLPSAGAVSVHYWRALSPTSLVHGSGMRYSEEEVRNVSILFGGKSLLPDERWAVALRVLNGNRDVAVNSADRVYPPIRLSWRFVDDPVSTAVGWDSRAMIPTVSPAGEVGFNVVVVPPKAAAQRRWLQFSFVQEGAFWAHDVGVTPLTVEWEPLIE